ncbi:unnamed protein product [Closterium sp. NIES-65]|nr:unnamed protein product [Closterium sp. NIES-65]CAI5996948.1 unnamed protein product [Closterium sp. NIES-65]
MEEWLCTLDNYGKAHGKSFMAAEDHVTSASHLLGLEKLAAATRNSLRTGGQESNQADSCGDGLELLIARLNATLRAYAKEERKRVRVTMSQLHRSVAEMKQAWLRDPGCARLKSMLDDKEAQLKSYHLVR